LVGEELFKLDHSQSFQQFGVNASAQEEVSIRNIAASKITEFSRPLNKSGQCIILLWERMHNGII
jgi:lysine N6-hydroxylase